MSVFGYPYFDLLSLACPCLYALELKCPFMIKLSQSESDRVKDTWVHAQIFSIRMSYEAYPLALTGAHSFHVALLCQVKAIQPVATAYRSFFRIPSSEEQSLIVS